MDAFELLLRASDANLNLDGDLKDIKPKFHMKPSFDYREHMESTMLDPIDSIMMLADQAAQKSPIRKRQVAPDSPDYRGLSTAGAEGGDGAFMNDNSAMGTLLQYGAYFNNMASPMNMGNNNRRSRAMSEPWIRQENWSEELQFNRTMGTSTSGNSGNPGQFSVGSAGLTNEQAFAPYNFGLNRDFSAPRGGLYNAEHELGHRLGYSTMETSLPQMLDQYSSIYNKNGRIGIYTREERSAIIHRFREKRKRRVWKKKIRYFCRKNLADRRVRVKGRFVKSAAAVKAAGSSNSSTSSGSADSPTNTSTTNTSSAAGTPHRAGRAARAGSVGTDITDASDLASTNKNTYGRQYAPTQRGRRGAPQSSPVQSVASARTAQSTGSARGRKALAQESDEEEEVEEDEDSDQDEVDSMEVVGGNLSTSSSISTYTTNDASMLSVQSELQKPRRFKLVLGSSDSSGGNTSDTNSHSDKLLLHLKNSAGSPSAQVRPSVFANPEDAVVKTEVPSGVDLLASLATKSLDQEEPDHSDDYDEQEDEDVFTSEMLRLPQHKRIRRHSIAY